ncbi:DUF3519 domain-containing protein [Campylobacter devanensis]|uniref:putative barnase/colicin E5 family endoribonuclease n=1 Tax=Campylobacter devanensis TaxID=3161138 RepID=UPI000A34DC12|nr:DUF3519 domain-containing protein [Campylobacter sp. P0106]
MENLYENFKKYAKKAYKQVEPLVPFSNANQYAFNPRSELYNNSQALDIQNDTDILNQQMANYRANQNGTFMLNALTKSDEQRGKDSIDFDNKFIDLAYSKGYTPHKAIDKDGKARYAIEKDGVFKEIEPSFLNDFKANSYEMLGSLAGVVSALPHPYAKTAGVVGKVLTPMVGSAVGSGAGAMADTYLNNKSVGENTTAQQLVNSFAGGANNDILGAGLATAITSKPAINALKGTAKTALNIADKGLAGVGARHILSQNIGGAGAALKANLGGDHEFRNALESAKDALGADLDNFVRQDLKTIDKTSDNRYIQKGIDIANSAINRVNETLKGLNVGKADAELLLSALGHENGVKNILDSVANNPQSAQKITEISSNLNKSFSDSINEQLAKFKTQTPKDSFKNSFNQVKKDYADTKDFLVKNSNYQSDFKDLNDNLATILSDTQNINTRGVFNALNGGGNLENLLNAKNAINEQLGYIMKADFKSSSDFINQKALNEAKSLIDNEINTALKNDENLINLYKSANGDYATMKNIVDSNLMNQISRDGKTSLEALNAMIKSNENINGVTLNEFLSSLGAKDRAIAEANIIKGLMEKNSVNGVVDFRALNQSLNSLDFGSEFAKELKSQILNRQALLNNTSDILNALGNKVVKSKNMSQGISTDPLKRAETMKANFVVEKLKPLIPRLGNNEALKLHLNKAILNANGDFKLAIKNIDNIPDDNLPTPTRNLLNEFKNAVKEIEKQVVKADNQAENQPNLANQLNGGNIDSLTKQISYLQNALKGDGFVTYPNSAKQIYPHNAIFEVPNEIRQIADIGDRVSASLEWLRSNHPEMFKTQRAVKEVIDYVLKEPENIVSPKKGDGVILSKQNDKKMDEIGINQNSEVFHANKRKLNSNEKQAVSGDALPPHLDADNISLTGRYSVGGKPHLTANEPMAETPKSQRKQQVLGVQMNTSKEHFSSANAETIPNQSIKQAETTAKTAEPTAEPKTAENTQGNSKILTNQDIKEQVSKWDLNAPKQTLITNKIDGEELEKLNEHFKFKGNYPLTRQIDSEHIKHALNHHGDEKTEALRGQKAITLDDISNYENYAKTADIKEYSDKKVISKKQINGHFVVVEEALTGKNRLNFVSMWYVKGKIKDVAPVSTPKNDLDRTLSNRYDSSNSTPKEIKSQEPTPQAKADEVDINPKSNYKKHERPIELDFQEAIDKGFNVDINALKHFYKNSGNSPLNYMREYMAELDQIEKKALGNEAKDRLKALYENFFYSVKAVETHNPNQITEYSSIGGQKEFEKIKEFRNEIEKAQTNQKALDALEKIEFVNNLENSPAFKLAKRQKTMKKEFIKEARNALKQATNLALKPLSQFLIKYGKSEEFLTKSSIISKIELENARGLRELKLNIRPIREFGTNYAEFYRDGQNAIKKLLTERQGQVAGAFHKDGLGDIDLVWGEFEVVKGEIKGYGLSKIVEKHLKDFSSFDGDTAQQKMANGIAEIIEKGEIKIDNNSRTTIVYNKNDKVYKIGLKQNWQGNPTENKWIVTAYDDIREANKIINSKGFTKGETLPLNSKPNSTPKEIKSQAQVEQKAKQYAKWLSQADKIPPQAPDELYKAYDKAKKDLKPKK